MKKRKGLYSHKIFTQLVFFSLLISLIPSLFITSLLFYKLEHMVKEGISDSYGQMASQYMKNLREKLSQYHDSLDVIAENTVIQAALLDEQEDPYEKGQKISIEVTKSLLLDRQREIRNCILYSSIDEYPAYGKSASMIREAIHEEWHLEERAIRDGCFSYISSAGDVPVLSFIKNIERIDFKNYDKKQLGLVKLDLFMDLLFEPAEAQNERDSVYDVFVYEDGGSLFYSSDPAKKDRFEAWLHTGNASGLTNGFTAKHEQLENCNLSILLLFDNQLLSSKQLAVRRLVLALMLLVCLLILFGAWIYSRRFSSRIGHLVHKFHRAETGDLQISCPIAGNDEIAELDRQFSHMLEKLDALLKKNYIWELENKKAQLKALQLQINPHFLYNTLETISSIAAIKQAFDICDICQKLGETFRYNLGKNYGEFVTMAQELGHVKNYIFICKKRYGSRFEVFYHICVDTEEVLTLRFILQPIIENAILHGIAKLNSTGTLGISAWVKNNTLMVRVEDDGMGMDAQKAEELNHSIHVSSDLAGSGLNIGIRNVNQRIKLAFGDEYGIFIRSALSCGSQFDIRLPLIRKGENPNEKKPADCR